MSELKKWILIFTAMLVFLSSMVLSAKGILAAPEDENQNQNPSIIIKAKGTYGNHTKRGAWFPLQVEVTNQGKDLHGDLRVTPNDIPLELNTMDYVSSVVLPQGATKSFIFYIPVQDSLTNLTIELLDADKVLAKQALNLTSLSDDQLVIGLLDRSEDGLTSLNALKQANWLSPILTTVKNEELPEKAELLNTFDMLVMDDINLKLSTEQAAALTHWVSRGGTLVVGGGSGWQKVLPNLPPELQAVTVSGVENKTLSALPQSLSEPISEAIGGPVRIANLQSTKGKPLFSEQGQPLAVKFSLGEGTVLFLAFDPALEPIANWTGTKVLWKDLLTDQASIESAAGSGQFGIIRFQGQSTDMNGMANALGNIEDMALPSLRTMAWIIGLYLLLAGFVNYLVLKKFDKREWTWITIPALASVFVVLIYLTSFKTRPAEIISHQINVIEVMPGTSLAKITAVTGLFAPTHATYHLQLQGEHLIGGLSDFGGFSRTDLQTNQRSNALISVEQTPEQTNLDFLQMRSWVMRGFSSVEDASLNGSISGEIAYKDNKWLATITNNTQYDFTDGVVLSSPNWFTKIAALKAGEKLETEINLNSMNNNRSKGAPLAYQIYNPQINWQGPGAPPRPQAKDMMRQQIFESQLGNEWDSRLGGKVLFFGWSTQPFQGGLTIEDNNVKKYYTTLFQVPLDLKFDPEHLEVPEGFIAGTLYSSQNIGMGPGSIMMQPNSEAEYQMELPEGKFSEMQLNIHQRNGASFSMVTGSLYNWKTAAWDDIGMTTDSTVIKDPANYINSERLVRFKVSNQAQTQSQSQFKQPQSFQEQEFYGVSISLSSKGGGQ